MKRLIACGAVDDGGMISISHRERFVERWKEQFKGQRFVLFVEKATRNLAQNALYWVWVDIIHQSNGWDEDYIHEYNKEHYNRVTRINTDPRTGEMTEVSFPGPTHDMAKDAFAQFMERVQRGWAAEGIDLPNSDERSQNGEHNVRD